jgi:lysyl-tRNA synthetase class 2
LHSRAADFLPTASWERLEFRAALLRRLRTFFEVRGFLEVETPLLSADAVVDLHIDPLPVILIEDPRRPHHGPRLWLQTSPEFGMKRLLAAGATRIFQVSKAFRAGESGAHHNPEFTMVEWYRVGDGLQDGIDLLAEFACHMLGTREVERISYRQAFLRHAGLDPHRATAETLAKRARELRLAPPTQLADDVDSWLNFLLAEFVAPRLGVDQPAILFDYPASQAALARIRPGTGSTDAVAERFELYVHGVELANGYHELLDAAELRRRNTLANAAREADGRYQVPPDSRLLAAMEHGLPPCSGVALGFDRLVMVAAGATSLHEVMAFPIARA